MEQLLDHFLHQDRDATLAAMDSDSTLPLDLLRNGPLLASRVSAMRPWHASVILIACERQARSVPVDFLVALLQSSERFHQSYALRIIGLADAITPALADAGRSAIWRLMESNEADVGFAMQCNFHWWIAARTGQPFGEP
jgi:hypothetical protein